MFRELPNEKWKEIIAKDYNPKKSKVYISNHGRVKKLKAGEKKYKLANLPASNKFLMFCYPREEKQQRMFCVHKMVGICFLEKTREDQKFVIHLDHNLKNNHVDNLKFVDQKELTKHQRTNPKFIKARKNWKPASKLNEGRVKLIKRKLFNPKGTGKVRIRLIAKQFGISESQVRRIKSGENWGHVTDF